MGRSRSADFMVANQLRPRTVGNRWEGFRRRFRARESSRLRLGGGAGGNRTREPVTDFVRNSLKLLNFASWRIKPKFECGKFVQSVL